MSHLQPTPSEPDNSLDWLAQQYALGELSAAEADAFELRLEADLAACEALSRAVQLLQTLALAGRPAEAVAASSIVTPVAAGQTVARGRQPWMRLAGWASVSVAVVLALVWGLNPAPTEPPQLAHDDMTVEHGQAVVAVWIDEADEFRSSDPVLQDDPLDDELDDDAAVPHWLLLAVAERHASPMSETEEVMQE